MSASLASDGRGLERLVHQLGAPLAAGVLVAATSSPVARYESGVIAFLAFVCGALVVPCRTRWSALTPVTGALLPSGGPALGATVLLASSVFADVPEVGAISLLAAFVVAALGSALAAGASEHAARRRPATRLAIIGSAPAAEILAEELGESGLSRYRLVGRISADATDVDGSRRVPRLGAVEHIRHLVRDHEIDLLLLAGHAGRMRVLEVIAASCLHLRVRLLELASFFEEACGHVPAGEINAAWFQHVAHPRYRPGVSAAKRAVDLFAVAVLGLPFLLLLAVLAPLIRRDGGPVFFWQTRIGEGGRELRICKLRTMRVGCSAERASADDPRVTPVGRVLRRTHLDELPQLLNILRGEMTLVGPRPEQPLFVERAEDMIPFYQRRHLLRPGLTGWAQVRCGYAGSDVGSAWKLCHDLYYLKHRSFGFDLAILLETVRTLIVRESRVADPPGRGFVTPQGAAVLEPVPVGNV